jgi:hypothetical protein
MGRRPDTAPGSSGRHRLATGVQQHDEEGDKRDDGGDKRDSGDSALVQLLRHPDVVAGGAHEYNGIGGVLAWISANRVWLVPYFSALLVVLIEVGFAIAREPLPPPAHVVVALFGLWAVGRGTRNRERQNRRERQLQEAAKILGVPPAELQDEFIEFLVRRDQQGGDHDVP